MAIYYECGNGLVETKWAKTYDPLDVYIVGPGPSLKKVQKDLRGRGRLIIGINTSYPFIKPDIWIGLDKPECFDRNLWFEPFKKVCRGNYSNIEFHGLAIKHFPETYFLSLSQAENIREIFTRRAHSANLVWDKSTLTAAINLAIWKGHKVIHFVGCDFGGSTDYVYGNTLTEELRKRNQRLYTNQINLLKQLTRLGISYGIKFVSCTPNSPINQFMEYKELKTALKNSAEYNSYSGSNKKILHTCEAEEIQETEPIIGHICEGITTKEIQDCIIAIANQQKTYKHKVFFSNAHNKNIKFLQEFVKRGIDIAFLDDFTEEILKEFNLHDIIDHRIENEITEGISFKSVNFEKLRSTTISKDIGVGIITYNRLDSLIRLIKSIRKFTDLTKIPVFVSDESDNEITWDWLKNQKDIISFKNKRKGIASNTNRIIECLKKFKYKIILNDDVEVQRNGWESFYPDIMKKTGIHHFLYQQHGVYSTVRPNSNEIIEIEQRPHGAVLVIDDECFKQVGYFDENFTFYGFEHVDYSDRIKKVFGYNFYYDYQGSDQYFKILDEVSSAQDKMEHFSKAREYYMQVKEIVDRIFIDSNAKNDLKQVSVFL